MEQLKSMKHQLTSIVQEQLNNTQNVDTKELGEAVDMIKDLAEAIYYCTITEAMGENNKEEKKQQHIMYYTPYKIYPDYYRDMDYNKMYYSDRMYGAGGATPSGIGMGSMGSNSREHQDRIMPREYPIEMRDYREGRSGMSRRTYMESKENHQSKEVQMKELEKYMKELSEDISEMIEDATPEERQVLHQKIMTLAEKVQA